MNGTTVLRFIQERQAILQRKDAGQPFPWTDDPILQKYFISNIRCEDDKTTRWLKKNWILPNEDDPDLFFAIAVFRRGFNLPATAEVLGYPVPWNPEHFKHVMGKLRPNCNPHAYKLLVGKKPGPQSVAAADHVLTPLWEQRAFIRPRPNDTLQSFAARLSTVNYMGSWHSYRVVADLKHTKQLKGASDWWTWMLLGPGTIRGLNRVLGLPVHTGVYQKDGCLITLSAKEKQSYIAEVNQLRSELRLDLDANDMGGALCEFDKYERVRLGEPGRVRKYKS